MQPSKINSQIEPCTEGIDPAKINQIRDFNFLQKNGRYILIDHVPKYYSASSTVSPPKTGSKGENTRTFNTFFDDLCSP